ncbi:MAG: tripartite tricarboxylate transporter substrate binding protein [Betaproteobacteria bacterium]|nr:MAG: tripartite tricarboxylate transporter substrate binding protein [Betaproteobacteria bacterium]
MLMRTVLFALLGLFAVLPTWGQAPAYPTKPIRFIVPLAPGGGADTFARFLAQQMSQSLAQQVIVENRPGGSGMIGGLYVVRSVPDGYTLLVGGTGQLVASITQRKIDMQRDYTPIALGMDQPYLLVVHPSLPVKSVAELIKFVRARPGEVIYASAGMGSAGHIAMELLRSAMGVEMIHVPYKGAGAALADVVAGQVPIIFSSPLGTVPLVRAGRLRPLAVSNKQRMAALPEVPTVSEAGITGFYTAAFLGLLGPPGLPRDIVSRLSAEVMRIVQRPESREWLQRQGAEPAPGTPEQMAERIRTDLEQFNKLLRDTNLKLN